MKRCSASLEFREKQSPPRRDDFAPLLWQKAAGRAVLTPPGPPAMPHRKMTPMSLNGKMARLGAFDPLRKVEQAGHAYLCG